MFISDMGAVWRPGAGREVASNGPYRDGSPSLYEGGVRVPAIFRWPGRIAADTECRALLSHLDVLPLCLVAAGLEPPTDRVLDGRNPVSALIGEKPSPHERMVYSLRGASAVRERTLKIVRNKPGDRWELYDLTADPGEANDLAAERPADVARLAGAFAEWEADVKRDASTPAPEPRPEPAARSASGN
jgi:arylsulfatase A-like enzyme